MSFSVGIVGLPNVGKSTLFNALTKQQAAASNFPFTTIDPNVGVINVPDERLAKLAALEKSEKIVPTSIEFVDIAGLVKGAAEGAGLGNKFLSHIREVDAIVQVVRFFENKDIIHVDGSVNPARDIEVINMELMLADLNTVSKRLESLHKEIKGGSKEALVLKSALEKIKTALEKGDLARSVNMNEEESRLMKGLSLLTMKPTLYVANASSKVEPLNGIEFLTIDVKIESELAELKDDERAEYMKELGINESGLDRLAAASYKLLNLITFITAGSKESKAWTIVAGTKAPQAAGVIHTDFEKGFIRAEIIQWDKLLEAGGYPGARDKGWLRVEGKEYVMMDGDVAHFRFNV
ncbi:MAG: redox-regulated ATPase YchF [Candidatus Doudnabacteria bacterium RIFCSPHIGHO2_01_FULL_45_18]|uniref:Ribosome-binding ATPase YchF n=1 Tax=Candidatus Doudnabacteria bacterium RIFCSPHIGHO2_01_FULL_45_18 TaxID=1817823 RepID=A0A1F5NQM5_9BACT|nr:MAG: redox-regulated ATPase YchF [Candidatus Doudnabacteria bacterium RIFCSPHIGHO2_01_FULL_45_18]